MAAGHPRLVFELVTFTDAQPRHYDVDEITSIEKALRQIKEWAVGQAQYGYQFLTCYLILTNQKTLCFLAIYV